MRPLARAAVAVASVLLGCGDGGGDGGGSPPPPSSPVTIGGTVSGLEGTGLVLQNDGEDPVTISGNGTFTFPTAIAEGASYQVTVRTPAAAQIPTGLIGCAVTNGSGTAGAQDVTDVRVDCRTTALFIGWDAAHGWELWKSDGTATGTVLVKDICPGACDSDPDGLVAAGGAVYLQADDGAHGVELWKSDGTQDGTVLVADIAPGAPDSGPEDFARCGDSVCFAAEDGVHGRELWRTDGTAAGTALVKDIAEGSSGAFSRGLTSLGANAFFNGSAQIWKSDGTEGGTVSVSATVAGHQVFCPSPRLAVLDGTVYFAGDIPPDRGVWASDGVTARLVAETTAALPPQMIGSAAGLVFFGTGESWTSGLSALWRTDGTEAGTLLLEEVALYQPAAEPAAQESRYLAELGGEVLFVANHGELWKTDGSPGGTARVKPLWSTTGTGSATMARFGDSVYLFQRGYTPLWRTDGTEQGTFSLWASPVRDVAVVNGALLAGAFDGLVQVNAAGDGTVPVSSTYFCGFQTCL